MPKRKLTPKLKLFLQENRWRVKQENYSGEALNYLKRLRASAKSAKKKKEAIAKVGKAIIPKNSDLYRIIEASAKLKKQSVAKFIRENEEEIKGLMEHDRVVISRETNYAITDINNLPRGNSIYINGNEVSKGDAIYALQNLASVSSRLSNVVVINYEMSYDLTGNLFLQFPTPDDYADLLDEINEMDDEEEEEQAWIDFIDRYEGLVYIRS